MYKWSLCFIVLALLAAPLRAVAQEGLESEKDKTSYSVGTRFGKFLQYGKDLIDLDVVKRGMSDVMEGRDRALSDEELDSLFQRLEQRMSKNREEMMAGEGNEFLAENAKKDGVVQLASGLQYKILTEGAGPTPASTDTVTTHYAGRLLDGTQFDSSYERGEPTSFPVGRVIPGWTEALLLMPVGSKWELYIPQDLAYGARGSPPVIPPFATLIFEIELIEIEDPETKPKVPGL